jgi:hypothetical protein
MKNILRCLAIISMTFIALPDPSFAVDCSSPPRGFGGSWARQYKSWCESCGGTYSSSGPSCTPGPNWGGGGSAPSYPSPSYDYEAERQRQLEIERQRQQAIEEQRMREEEETKKRHEEFERNKQEALKSMKSITEGELGLKGFGVGGDLGLKGAGETKAGALGLKEIGETPVVDPKVRQERDEFAKMNEAWMRNQKQLIEQRIRKPNKWFGAIYASLKTNEPPPPYYLKKLDELQPGDVLLISPDKGNGLEALKSKTIRFADRLSSWEWKSPASHTVLFIKEVNGKKLFLDNTSNGDRDTAAGVGPHIITGEEFLKIYSTRETHIAQPVSKLDGHKLWAAARKLSVKELADEPRKSANVIDKTDYGLYGDDNMVCSEASRWALIEAGKGAKAGAIPDTRSPFKKLFGVYFGPANFFSGHQYFIITPMGALPSAKE